MDIEYLLMLQNFREMTSERLNGLFTLLTKAGELSVLMFLLAAVYWCVDKKQGLFLLGTFHANRIVNGFVKITACVYRPWIRDARLTPVPSAQAGATGYSFPSGHTANATSFWGGLAVSKGKLTIPVWCGVIMVLLIGLSRNYLGVHTPQDVVVSIVIGAVVLWGTDRVVRMLESHPKRDVWVLACGAVSCVLLILYAALKSYPADYDADGALIVDGAKMALDSFKNAGMGLGFFLGWFLERRFIRFSVDGSFLERVIRYGVCIGLYLLVRDWAAPLVASAIGGGVGSAVGQFLCVLYIMAGAPVLIKLYARVVRKAAESA